MTSEPVSDDQDRPRARVLSGEGLYKHQPVRYRIIDHGPNRTATGELRFDTDRDFVDQMITADADRYAPLRELALPDGSTLVFHARPLSRGPDSSWRVDLDLTVKIEGHIVRTNSGSA